MKFLLLPPLLLFTSSIADVAPLFGVVVSCCTLPAPKRRKKRVDNCFV